MGSLIYPAGASPGFDPTHIAANSCTLAAIASAGSFIDLLTGKPGTVAGTPTAAMHGVIGPCVKFNGGSDNVAISGKKTYSTTTAPLNVTLAAIILLNASAAAEAFLSLGTSGVDASYTYFGTSGASATPIAIGNQGLANVSVAWTASLSVPFFVAASQSLSATSGATQTGNLILTRLDTGQTYTGTGSNGSYTTGSRNGTYNIGSRGASNIPATANIAAVMASDNFLSLAALRQWASDPWAFWYPK